MSAQRATAAEPVPAAAARAVLAVEDLTVFRGPLPAVRDVSFSVRDREALGVLGRNGAGKTTLLGALAGVLPVEGRIELFGEDVTRVPAWQRARRGLAIVPQGRQLLGDLSVGDNLRVARLEPAGDGPEFDVHGLFPAIPALLDRKAAFLSGGEQQQVAIARALIRRPRVLLLDEPTEGLAPAVVREIESVLKHLGGEGLTIVLAEQHHHIVADLCSDILVLRGGEVAGYEKADAASIDRYRATL